MALSRAADAADTMDMVSIVIVAWCQCDGMAMNTLASYLQTRQQRSRAAGPRESDRQEIAGMLDAPSPDAGREGRTNRGIEAITVAT
ncbi:hypothetical protein [Streptomyces sp. NPDC002403]